jgi:phytoene dehydrogenase-like protein
MRVAVVGAGLNGLVAAAYLASHKASVVVLDRNPIAGGAAITKEFAPGFRAPAYSHALGPVHRDVVRALHLDRAGIEFTLPDPALTTLGHGGKTIIFHRDPVLTAGSIHRVASGDAVRWSEFLKVTHRIAGLASKISREPPPSVDDLTAREWWALLSVGRKARALGRRDLARLVRWMPMSVADLVGEWFESDLLRAAISAQAIFGNAAGPMSAGTGAMLLQRFGVDPHPLGSGATVRGGPGALTDALVQMVKHHGGTVRTNARVSRIATRAGRVKSVVLESGDEITADVVLAAVSPAETFGHLVDPIDLPPTFLERIRHVRARGVTAKINLALGGPPVFNELDGDPVPLRGRLLVAPTVLYLERAFDATKYGQMSAEPWLEIVVPTMTDQSLAKEGQHVMSIYAHFAPRHLRGASWADQRTALLESVLRVLDPHAPALRKLIAAVDVLTPEDIETGLGLPGGHIFHGEPTLDQSWLARPLLGWAQYRTPIAGLYLASAGAHPGGGLTGLPGLLAARAVRPTS